MSLNIPRKQIQPLPGHSAMYPEVWGGFECTVNRLEDVYRDQLQLTGHDNRLDDIKLIGALGIKTMRYPVLWERVQTSNGYNWSWTDERLGLLKDLGIKPIAGLLHHGSGIEETNLLDPDFPDKLSVYAATVASRYPWIDHYTPINEPLTTARFSCLYGHWYPHYRDSFAFARSILIQCRAIIQSMKAIKVINPNAKLVQTEDLGKTYSTDHLKYQADFENLRRWLTFDLLCGYVNKHHPMWDYFLSLGVSEDELQFFLDEPYPPDVIGVNYYITGQRYLDENLSAYPPGTHGGNGIENYADVEAVRVNNSGIEGVEVLLEEVWNRYKLPIAITEVHLHCTREEQLRWLKDKWDVSVELNKKGIPIIAVTPWAMLGSFDWCSLLTQDCNIYEPGVFDIRAPKPRATVLAKFIESITAGKKFEHPVLMSPGWWKRDDSKIYGINHSFDTASNPNVRPILITGKTGTLGKAFAELCKRRGLEFYVTSRDEMDIADEEQVRRKIAELKPWAVVNTAGYVNVDRAELGPESCYRENTDGAVNLARVCAESDIKYLSFSSDLVFDGKKASAYTESDIVNPLNVYGHSKANAEKLITEIDPNALIIRTSAFFGPWDEYNFITQSINQITAGIKIEAADDLLVSPTYVPDLVNTSLDLLIDDEKGIWHLANKGKVTWADFLKKALTLSGISEDMVIPVNSSKFDFAAARPINSSLTSEKADIMPTLESALERYCSEKILILA